MEVTGKIFELYGSTYKPLKSDPGTASHQLHSDVTDDYPLSPALQLNCLLFQLIFSQPANETAMKNGAKASLVFHGLMCSSVSSFCMPVFACFAAPRACVRLGDWASVPVPPLGFDQGCVTSYRLPP